MSGDPDPRRTRTKLLLVFGAIGVIALVVAAILLWPRATVETPEGVEAELQRSPALRDTMRALKTSYPDEHRALLQRVAAAARREGRRAASEEVGRALLAFLAGKSDALASAPAADLQRLAGAQLALIRALSRENVAACAQFAMSALRDPAGLSPGTVALLSRVTVLQIEVARAGERSGLQPRAQASQAEGSLWLERVRAIDTAAADDLESGMIEQVGPERQCRAGVAIHQALTELPADTAASIEALLLREAVARPWGR